MRPWRNRWCDELARAEGWLLPGCCLACGGATRGTADPLICDLCRARWRPLAQPTCPRCGTTLSGFACRICADWPRDLTTVQSAVLLDDGVRHLMHRFKYNGWRRLAESMAPAMVPLLARLPPGPLVPIPISAGRRRRRGYNQAADLAREVGRLSGRAVWAGALHRVSDGASQTGFGAADRLANLAGAFRASRIAPHLVLVDDVFTTGATLVSAAATMLEGGTLELAAVTFARAEPPVARAAHHLTIDSSRSERD